MGVQTELLELRDFVIFQSVESFMLHGWLIIWRAKFKDAESAVEFSLLSVALHCIVGKSAHCVTSGRVQQLYLDVLKTCNTHPLKILSDYICWSDFDQLCFHFQSTDFFFVQTILQYWSLLSQNTSLGNNTTFVKVVSIETSLKMNRLETWLSVDESMLYPGPLVNHTFLICIGQILVR